jgi:flagellar biosynthesis GTPase FlhF
LPQGNQIKQFFTKGVTIMTKLKTSRGLIKYLFFTLITFGIYPFFFIRSMARDLNLACAEDNRKTAGLLKYILLSIITCGIYSIIWMWCTADRIASYGQRHNVPTKTSGVSWFMWNLFGSLLCGLGPFIAMHNYLKSMNLICRDAIAREKAEAEAAAQAAAQAEADAARAAQDAANAQAAAAAQAAMIAEAVAQALAAQKAAAPAPEAPAEEAPAEEAPAEETPAEEAPAEEATAEEAPAEETTEA